MSRDRQEQIEHAPGPWEYEHKPSGRYDQRPIVGQGRQIVGWLPNNPFGVETWTDQDEANARLICAAPDLLASERENLRAMEELLGALEPVIGSPGIGLLQARIRQTRAAIVKAEHHRKG